MTADVVEKITVNSLLRAFVISDALWATCAVYGYLVAEQIRLREQGRSTPHVPFHKLRSHRS
jgi:hypothetical protein